MKSKQIIKSLSVKAKRLRSVDKKLIRTYVSLFLILILIASSGFAWFTERYTSRMSSGVLEFQSASSLRINKDKFSAKKITIPAFTLDEASSLDGRNVFFPLGESFSNTNDPSDKHFREATMGDRITETGNTNKGHYVYKDFELKGTSGNTPVYIKSYEIKIEEADSPHDTDVNAVYHDHLEIGYDSSGKPNSQALPPDNCPIRLAFIADSGVAPVVIDPSAQVIDYVDNSPYAVSLVNENGVPETKNTSPDTANNNIGSNWDSFQSYYYGNTPLFVIPGGQVLNVTLVIWLEGTLDNCDKYIGKKISVDIDIESNFADMDTITFYDDTLPDKANGQTHWVSNDNPIIACAYEDPYSDETPKRWKTIIMAKTANYTWQAKIPKKAVTNISFYRLSRANDSSQGTIYNAWHTTESISTWVTASSISNGWYASGRFDLQTTRQHFDSSTNTNVNALVYKAVHGNGYSITNDTSKRLAPCVGYWDYSGGGTPTPTQAPTQPSGGGSSGSTASITVNVNTSIQTWINTNVQYNGSTLYFKTANGGKYPLDRIGENSFSKTVTLDVGDIITQFSIEDSANIEYRTWVASPTFEVTSAMVADGYTANYSVNNNNDKMLM